MFTLVLPLLWAAVPTEAVASPRVAQVRLAETLAGADAIERVTVGWRAVTFAIVADGGPLAVTARTSRAGVVVAFEIAPAMRGAAQLHAFSWLAAELADAPAITRLVVGGDGRLRLITSDDRRY